LSPDERARLIQAVLDYRDEDGFASGIYGVEVCQLCGEIGTFQGWATAVGSHLAGEFVGPGHRHPPATDSGLRELLADRDARFCEVCRKAVRRQEARRVGRYWLCANCDPARISPRRRYLELRSDAELRAHAKSLGL
jgi:hypothetical protein